MPKYETWNCEHSWKTISKYSSWASDSADAEPPDGLPIYVQQRCSKCGAERTIIEEE